MAGDLRSSILTTAAVAVSVAGLTVIQPLTAAPPLLLAALLMDGGSSDSDGVGGIADAIQGKLLPSDGRAVMINFLTGPFGMWNALDEPDGSYGTVPSTTLGVAGLPFLNQQGWTVTPPALPPLAPGLPPAVQPTQVLPAPVVSFDLPSLQIGESIVTPPPPQQQPIPAPGPGDVVTSYKFGLGAYAPVTLLNPITLTNTVAEYLNRALSPVRVNPDGTVTCRLSCEDLGVTKERIGDVLYVTFKNPDGTLVKAKVETRNGVTYVTYDDEGALPLVRPLRDYFGLFGNELADIIEPALTALVYWGYRDATEGTNSLLPTPAETIKAVLDFLVGVKEGIESLFVAHSPAADKTLARTEDVDAEEPVAEEDDRPSSEPQPSAPAEDDPKDEVTPPAQETPAEEEPVEDQPTEDEAVDEPTDDATTEEPADDETAEETPETDPGDTDPKDNESGDGDDKDNGRKSYTEHRDRDSVKDRGAKKDNEGNDTTSSPSSDRSDQ